MKNIYFSIIVLVYNTKEEYLRYALSSILNQHYSNFEVIIIDDGSNEETKEILKDYEKKCIIKHQENKGMPASRLEGLRLATGDYVIFVDSDDYINPDTLSIYNEIITKYNVDIVMQDFVKFQDNIYNIIKHNDFFTEGLIDKKEVIRQLCMLHANGTCGRGVKRELFNGMAKELDTSIAVGEDVQQSAYVLLNANSFYYTKEKIYYYRIIDEHREYNDITNLNDCNFLTPVYNIVFKERDDYSDLLPVFKSSAANSIIYNSFRICLWLENKEQKHVLLNKLNTLEITTIIKNIDAKLPFPSNVLFYLLTSKKYALLNLAANLYDLIYGVQRI